MLKPRFFTAILAGAAMALAASTALAADYPAPKEGDWIAKEFKFSTGETLNDVRLHYTTVGAPRSEEHTSELQSH